MTVTASQQPIPLSQPSGRTRSPCNPAATGRPSHQLVAQPGRPRPGTEHSPASSDIKYGTFDGYQNTKFLHEASTSPLQPLSSSLLDLVARDCLGPTSRTKPEGVLLLSRPFAAVGRFTKTLPMLHSLPHRHVHAAPVTLLPQAPHCSSLGPARLVAALLHGPRGSVT